MNSCIICEHVTEVLHDIQFKQDYYLCENCDFITLDSIKVLSHAEEKTCYDYHNNSIENEGYVNMFLLFLKKVYKYKDEKEIKNVIDFGSGPGPVLFELLKRDGYNTDKYDPYFSPEKVYINKKYDLITCTEVIEHLKDPLKTFELFSNLLNKGGALALMTLFHPKDNEIFQDWWYRRDDTHISFYTPKTLGVLAEKFGMEVVFSDEKNTVVMKRV